MPPLANPTMEDEGTGFLKVAIQHGLLEELQAEEILTHAHQHSLNPSDAALTLSILELHEVDAIQLLRDPQRLAPGYELIDLLGCGAGGMVFRARQTALGRDVALKTINQNASNAKTTGQSRIQREAHAIARLRHPGIVAAIDSGFYQGRFCIAMELVEGENLVSFINREAPVAEHTVWHIARQVAGALSHAAASGIIHRDIKPANLLLCKPPSGMELPPGVPFVKVADFGLAFESTGPEANQLTQTGMTLGTPAYVAPEQLHDTHVDARADIYSLGATVFHMLTGFAPCSDQSPMRTIMQKTIGDDRWRDQIPESVSAETVRLFRDMTHCDLEERISDYDSLLTRIDELLDPKAGIGNPESRLKSDHPIEDIRKPRIKRLPEMLLALVGSLTLCGGIAVYWFAGTEPITRNDSTQSRWEIDGFPQPLFNGESVPLFRQAGSWSPSIEADGSRVLTGTQGSTMTIPLVMKQGPSAKTAAAKNMRFRIGVSLPGEGTVDLEIAFDDHDRDKLAVLRLQNGNAEWIPQKLAAEPFSNQPADQPDNQPADQLDDASRTVVKLPDTDSSDVVFQRVSIVRQANQCIVSINNDVFPPIECAEDSPASVRLRCVNGTAHFGDIDMVAMKLLGSAVASPSQR